MLRLCLSIAGSIAAGIALAYAAAAASAQEPELPAPEPPIQRFYVRGPVVDGIPAYYPEWRVWSRGEWVPLTSQQGQHTVFGIKTAPDPRPVIPAPPIAKHQRRME